MGRGTRQSLGLLELRGESWETGETTAAGAGRSRALERKGLQQDVLRITLESQLNTDQQGRRRTLPGQGKELLERTGTIPRSSHRPGTVQLPVTTVGKPGDQQSN